MTSLGHRVLDLETRVHLEEEDLAAVVEEELAGPGAHVADRAGERERGLAEPCAGAPARRRATASPRGPSGGGAGSSSRARRGGRRRRGRRTGPGPRRGAAPSMSRSRIEPVVAECGVRLAPGGRERVRQARRASRTDRMPLPPPPAAGLTSSGKPIRSAARRERLVGLVVAVVAGRRPGRRASPARRRAAALSPIARIAAGGGPTQRMPGGDHGLGEVRVLGEEAEPRMDASAPAARAAATTASMSRRSRASGPVGRRDDGPDPERGRRSGGCGAAISPRLAMNSVRIGMRAAGAAVDARSASLERVNRVRRDTPSTTDASRGQPPGRDPALDGPRRRPDPPRGLARAQFLAHACRDCRMSSSPAAHAASGSVVVRLPRPAVASR